METEYDFLIIGGGISGLAAAMYGARLGMKTIVFGSASGSEMPLGGVITTTSVVENYPGFIKISGSELAEKIREHALSYELVEMKEERVEDVKKEGGKFRVITNKKEYLGKTILIATGTKWRKIEVPGGKEFENKGVAYCALCDAPLYKGKTISVIGGSDSAIKNALVLARHAKKVYIVCKKGNIYAEPINLKRVEEEEKIEVITNTNVIKIKGDDVVRQIVLDKLHNGKEELEVDGVFVAIGHIVLSEIGAKLGVKLNKNKQIIINHKTSETNVEGVFAAGDVCDKRFKQAITGVAQGCSAAYSAYEYINGVRSSFSNQF